MTVVELICAAFVAAALPNADVACEHMEMVVDASERYNVDPVVMTALIHIESRWTPTARSRSNACGLTQILPKYTSKFYGGRASCRQLYNPKLSIYKGTDIMGRYLKRYKRNYRRSLCSYNAGPRRCVRGHGPTKGTRYARMVLKTARKLKWQMDRIKEEEGYTDASVPGCYE